MRKKCEENKAEKRGLAFSSQAQFLGNASCARSTFLLYRSKLARLSSPRPIDKEISARLPRDYVVPVVVNR